MPRKLIKDPKVHEMIIRIDPRIKESILELSEYYQCTQTDLIMKELNLIYSEIRNGELTSEQFT
jgi:hypothetical protein